MLFIKSSVKSIFAIFNEQVVDVTISRKSAFVIIFCVIKEYEEIIKILETFLSFREIDETNCHYISNICRHWSVEYDVAERRNTKTAPKIYISANHPNLIFEMQMGQENSIYKNLYQF